jgi:HD superfamily phosphohydrolase YqeK
MQNRDQRHSLDVLRRFDSLYNAATRDERAAALLHDVGKCESQLGWLGRIIATMVGPRTDSFRRYLDHEQIGLALISNASPARTSEVLKGDIVDDCVRALRDADNI